jgi:hypothetical protein
MTQGQVITLCCLGVVAILLVYFTAESIYRRRAKKTPVETFEPHAGKTLGL